MKDRMDFAAALEAGNVTPQSAAATLANADAEAARALAAAALAQLPVGPADGEDEEAWAAFGLTASAEDSWDFVADALDVAEIPATDSIDVPTDMADVLAPSMPDVYAPTAPQFVKAPPNRGWMYGLAAMLLAGVGAFGLWFALDDKDGSDRFIGPVSAASQAAAPVVPTPKSVGSNASATAPVGVPSAAPTSAVPMASRTSAPLAPPTAAPASRPKNTPRPKSRARRSPRRASPPKAAPKPVAAPPKTPARKPRKSNGEVDDLLSNLDGGGRKAPARRPRTAGEVAGDPMLPTKLSKSQILGVVRRNAGKVGSCKSRDPNASGAIKIQMVIEPTGRVSSARPQGKYAGTPVGVCAASKVRTFRFPQFKGDAMRINMPFQL